MGAGKLTISERISERFSVFCGAISTQPEEGSFQTWRGLAADMRVKTAGISTQIGAQFLRGAGMIVSRCGAGWRGTEAQERGSNYAVKGKPAGVLTRTIGSLSARAVSNLKDQP